MAKLESHASFITDDGMTFTPRSRGKSITARMEENRDPEALRNRVKKEGYMYKKGKHRLEGWKSSYFVLKGERLWRFINKDDQSAHRVYEVSGSTIAVPKKVKNPPNTLTKSVNIQDTGLWYEFRLQGPYIKGCLNLACSNAYEKESWLDMLRLASQIERAQMQEPLDPAENLSWRKAWTAKVKVGDIKSGGFSAYGVVEKEKRFLLQDFPFLYLFPPDVTQNTSSTGCLFLRGARVNKDGNVVRLHLSVPVRPNDPPAMSNIDVSFASRDDMETWHQAFSALQEEMLPCKWESDTIICPWYNDEDHNQYSHTRKLDEPETKPTSNYNLGGANQTVTNEVMGTVVKRFTNEAPNIKQILQEELQTYRAKSRSGKPDDKYPEPPAPPPSQTQPDAPTEAKRASVESIHVSPSPSPGPSPSSPPFEVEQPLYAPVIVARPLPVPSQEYRPPPVPEPASFLPQREPSARHVYFAPLLVEASTLTDVTLPENHEEWKERFYMSERRADDLAAIIKDKNCSLGDMAEELDGVLRQQNEALRTIDALRGEIEVMKKKIPELAREKEDESTNTPYAWGMHGPIYDREKENSSVLEALGIAQRQRDTFASEASELRSALARSEQRVRDLNETLEDMQNRANFTLHDSLKKKEESLTSSWVTTVSSSHLSYEPLILKSVTDFIEARNESWIELRSLDLLYSSRIDRHSNVVNKERAMKEEIERLRSQIDEKTASERKWMAKYLEVELRESALADQVQRLSSMFELQNEHRRLNTRGTLIEGISLLDTQTSKILPVISPGTSTIHSPVASIQNTMPKYNEHTTTIVQRPTIGLSDSVRCGIVGEEGPSSINVYDSQGERRHRTNPMSQASIQAPRDTHSGTSHGGKYAIQHGNGAIAKVALAVIDKLTTEIKTLESHTVGQPTEMAMDVRRQRLHARSSTRANAGREPQNTPVEHSRAVHVSLASNSYQTTASSDHKPSHYARRTGYNTESPQYTPSNNQTPHASPQCHYHPVSPHTRRQQGAKGATWCSESLSSPTSAFPIAPRVMPEKVPSKNTTPASNVCRSPSPAQNQPSEPLAFHIVPTFGRQVISSELQQQKGFRSISKPTESFRCYLPDEDSGSDSSYDETHCSSAPSETSQDLRDLIHARNAITSFSLNKSS